MPRLRTVCRVTSARVCEHGARLGSKMVISRSALARIDLPTDHYVEGQVRKNLDRAAKATTLVKMSVSFGETREPRYHKLTGSQSVESKRRWDEM